MNVRIHRGEREGRRGIPLYQSWRLPRPGLCLPVIVLAAAFAMMGMSGDANSEPRRLPTPKKNFTATITDESATTTKAELVTCGGKTYLTAYQGKMKMRVPFAKIERVTFHDSDNRYRTARILFWNGEKHELLAKKF
ncbi:MAG: hypothetical protein M5R36_02720 [Deltaproteobacteria bacterium]|nr:hypothetical protein [Deltaproteobacteria bacterium]